MPWLEVLVGVVMVLGLIGTVVPVWPGLAVVWLAGLVYGLFAGFGTVGLVCFAIMTVLAVVGIVTSVVLPHRGGRTRGAPGSTMLAGFVGAIVGVVVLPVVGLPVGALVGVWVAERARLEDPGEAWHTTIGVLKGFGIDALVELGLGMVMIAAWLVWAIAGG